MRSDILRLAQEVFRTYHVPGHELHHAFGRVGRLKACALFLVPLLPKEHQGPASAEIIKALRVQKRDSFNAMVEANAGNRDPCSCWFVDCPKAFQSECPLWRRAKKAMEV